MILGGLILIGIAFCTILWTIIDEHRAAQSVQQTLDSFETKVSQSPSHETETLTKYFEQEMPIVTTNGVDYLGTVEILVLELSLPIISKCDDDLLKIAPCRYKGNIYNDNMIIAGHNYQSHFAKLKKLKIGDTINFVDVEKNVYSYTVSKFEEIDGTDIDEMNEGNWDLTLFTCTLGGKSRFTVRCVKKT